MAIALVTGGAGFIGSHLVEALLERGDDVRVLDNLSTGKIANLQGLMDSIEFIEGDIRNSDDLIKAIKGIDQVFHQAAFVSVPLSLEQPDVCINANVQGTQQLLELSRQAGVDRVVLASSAAVYGENSDFPLDEYGNTDPLSPYAVSKLISEIFTKMYSHQLGLDVVALRYFNIFGPRQNPDSDYAAVIPIFIKLLVDKRKPVIYGDGNQSRDFVFVKDVVQANLLASVSTSAPGRVINICSGLETSLLDLLAALSDIFGLSIRPEFETTRAGDIYRSVGDPNLAKEILGFIPQTTLYEGLQATVDWFKKNAGE